MLQHLWHRFPPPQRQFAPTFHQSVFVRGGRTSEHPELWPDFVNPLLLDLQGGEHKKRIRMVKPPACDEQNLCCFARQFPSLPKQAAFVQKHRKIPAAIDAASEDKAITSRVHLLAKSGKFFHST